MDRAAGLVLAVVFACTSASSAVAQGLQRAIFFVAEQFPDETGQVNFDLTLSYTRLDGQDVDVALESPGGTTVNFSSSGIDIFKTIHHTAFDDLAANISGAWSVTETTLSGTTVYSINTPVISRELVYTGTPVITSPAAGAVVHPEFDVAWTLPEVGLFAAAELSSGVQFRGAVSDFDFTAAQRTPLSGPCCATAVTLPRLTDGEAPLDIAVTVSPYFTIPPITGNDDVLRSTLISYSYQTRSAYVPLIVLPEPNAALLIVACVGGALLSGPPRMGAL